ncbi:uncharacterized protein LOC130693040 [Daphnia carinata]|uniref:uncharacterized protein LOC130693040 n=1 Tax=Daphnia carinata TaxID=120202 RepID=UPI0025797C9F|nr:uncharacterized protein LOC130693040 [Daphnia carinata]
MSSTQYEYCPDPEDSDLVFNIPSGKYAKESAVEINEPASDLDEAPDEVSFSKAKTAALSILNAEEQMKKTTKGEKKKQGQKKEALMKEQKHKHLQSLVSKRLPNNLVDTISAQPMQFQEGSKVKRRKEFKSKDTSSKHIRFEHYIPLETDDVTSPDFSVAILASKKWKNKFSKPGFSIATNFRQQMLYGQKNQRQSTKKIDQARLKQTLSGKSQLVGC